MKIALVIFRLGPSHGSILQTYALSEILKRMGHSVTIFDRQLQVPFIQILIRGLYNLKSIIINGYRGPVFYTGVRPSQIMSNLNVFIEKYIRKNTITTHSDDELQKYINENYYDAFVVGSDQTWRPRYVRDIYYYYLSFLGDKRVKRLSYAPSFGTEDWEYNEEQERICKELINKFDAISVREQSAVYLCKTHFNVEAHWVLDPTMLLTSLDYDAVLQTQRCTHNTLAYSILDNEKYKYDIIEHVASIRHLTPIRINAKNENTMSPIDDRVCPSIEYWLTGIRDSSFVVADSFHATVFAIIFNKPFLTIANRERGLSRFKSLLDAFNLGERLVTNISDVSSELLSNTIDWVDVNLKIEEFRKKSIQFLDENLK